MEEVGGHIIPVMVPDMVARRDWLEDYHASGFGAADNRTRVWVTTSDRTGGARDKADFLPDRADRAIASAVNLNQSLSN